jgi:branched-chain amino acid transport system substrate-binding protein
VANPPGQQVASFAEGKAALKKGKINYEGASSALDFDATGDVTPTFGAWSVESGKLVMKYKFQA